MNPLKHMRKDEKKGSAAAYCSIYYFIGWGDIAMAPTTRQAGEYDPTIEEILATPSSSRLKIAWTVSY
jgi:hypothetical protein